MKIFSRSLCNSLKSIRISFRVIFFALLLVAAVNGRAQTVILAQNFDSGGGFIPPGGWWSLQQGGSNLWTTMTNGTSHSGSFAAEYIYNPTLPANAWLMSAGCSLIGGVTYTITYWENTSGSYPENLRVTVGLTPTIAAQTTILQTLTGLMNSTYVMQTVSFTPATSGNYFFGFNCNSLANEWYLDLDDVFITMPNNSIVTTALAGSSFCSGAPVSVPYTAVGTFNAGNVFTAQLSNSAGSFVAPTTIGTLSSTISGSIAALIPALTGSGAGYRIRVISNNPATIGTDNGTNLTITSLPTVTGTPGFGCGPGSMVTLMASPSAGTVNWYSASTGGISLFTGTMYSVMPFATTTYYADATNNGCVSSPRTAVLATKFALPVASAGINQTICSGQSVAIGGSPSAMGGSFPYTYLWFPGTNLSSTFSANPTANPTVTQTYNLTVTDVNNCMSAPASVTLTIPANGGAGTWTWTGLSVNWFDACNWDKKCLPDASSDVVIPGGTPNNPTITGAAASCNTINIVTTNGASININTTASGSLSVTQ
jgi:hypothetical protein